MDLSMFRMTDISPRLSSRTAVFPGDVSLSQEVLLDFSRGNHLKLSALHSTVHLGAHADAPGHYDKQGKDIADVDPRIYFGLCEVVSAHVAPGQRVELHHLPEHFVPKASRVLVRTESFPDSEQWNSDFCSLHPSLVAYLAASGVKLIGIDTPSIDPEESKSLEAHQEVARHGLAILEGLVLSGVQPGLYNLIALPLALEGFDASPVRAILLSLS